MISILSETTWHQDTQDKIWRQKASKSTSYTLDRIVGAGSQGKVYLLHCDSGGKGKIAKIASSSLKNDFDVSRRYPHRAVGLMLRAKAYLQTTKCTMIIMHKYESNMKPLISTMTTKQKVEAICQLCKGIAQLHALDIVHRDIELSNIFYDRAKNRYDIGDFGYAITSQNDIEKKGDLRTFKRVVESILLGIEAEPVKKQVLLTPIQNPRDEIAELINSILPKTPITVDSLEYIQRLKTKEQLFELGFPPAACDLLLSYMNNAPDTIEATCSLFDQLIKQQV